MQSAKPSKSVFLDQKFYEDENKLLRELAKHWEQMYRDLYTRYEEVVKDYDNLVMETIKKDLNND